MPTKEKSNPVGDIVNNLWGMVLGDETGDGNSCITYDDASTLMDLPSRYDKPPKNSRGRQSYRDAPPPDQYEYVRPNEARRSSHYYRKHTEKDRFKYKYDDEDSGVVVGASRNRLLPDEESTVEVYYDPKKGKYIPQVPEPHSKKTISRSYKHGSNSSQDAYYPTKPKHRFTGRVFSGQSRSSSSEGSQRAARIKTRDSHARSASKSTKHIVEDRAEKPPRYDRAFTTGRERNRHKFGGLDVGVDEEAREFDHDHDRAYNRGRYSSRRDSYDYFYEPRDPASRGSSSARPLRRTCSANERKSRDPHHSCPNCRLHSSSAHNKKKLVFGMR